MSVEPQTDPHAAWLERERRHLLKRVSEFDRAHLEAMAVAMNDAIQLLSGWSPLPYGSPSEVAANAQAHLQRLMDRFGALAEHGPVRKPATPDDEQAA